MDPPHGPAVEPVNILRIVAVVAVSVTALGLLIYYCCKRYAMSED